MAFFSTSRIPVYSKRICIRLECSEMCPLHAVFWQRVGLLCIRVYLRLPSFFSKYTAVYPCVFKATFIFFQIHTRSAEYDGGRGGRIPCNIEYTTTGIRPVANTQEYTLRIRENGIHLPAPVYPHRIQRIPPEYPCIRVFECICKKKKVYL